MATYDLKLSVEGMLLSTYLAAEVTAMAFAARPWLSARDAQDVAANIANPAEQGEDVVTLATTSIEHRRATLGLHIAPADVRVCAAAMAAAWVAARLGGAA